MRLTTGVRDRQASDRANEQTTCIVVSRVVYVSQRVVCQMECNYFIIEFDAIDWHLI